MDAAHSACSKVELNRERVCKTKHLRTPVNGANVANVQSLQTSRATLACRCCWPIAATTKRSHVVTQQLAASACPLNSPDKLSRSRPSYGRDPFHLQVLLAHCSSLEAALLSTQELLLKRDEDFRAQQDEQYMKVGAVIAAGGTKPFVFVSRSGERHDSGL